MEAARQSRHYLRFLQIATNIMRFSQIPPNSNSNSCPLQTRSCNKRVSDLNFKSSCLRGPPIEESLVLLRVSHLRLFHHGSIFLYSLEHPLILCLCNYHQLGLPVVFLTRNFT
ncbi:unnamed protein product [Kuraishia capsulata CBS 1993]|uniref:Uncharacterized protein n=1 Tax=Kuraishia capsulata CBS 1993 TaxID=1382522 RepID=W6MG80_9ASCO|nr:uncharacterized protein KUCA_T00000732001 [Kuraishia capsulata CBS 1993]CDK24766.1 unnamed protein product [Kuraishia capsulata CBS 1993]